MRRSEISQSSIEDKRLKGLLKTAIVEVLEERRDLVCDLLEEAFEDMALARAIDEGRTSRLVDRKQIAAILDGGR